ncbi:histidine kinase [Nocardia sp. AG03]|uniref:sensor histidine kinase n=1 Tax=Nocardia sp. AG03 TaxID=3025312 RepID=UPI0024186FA2|nr:histidine kinase [Nocardia sp. AG03]
MSDPHGTPSRAPRGFGAASLALIAGLCVLNGCFLDALPLERQLVFAALTVVAYLHGRRVAMARGWPVLGVVALPALGCAVVDFSVGFGALLCLLVFVVLPWLAGRFRRQQAELVVASRQRVARLEQEQALLAERVTLRERARIATEMHDSLGHDLALIALQAGALELSTELSEANRAAAQRLRTSAVTATDRLRASVAVLREGAIPATPRDEPVTDLVRRAVEAGMTVELHQPIEPNTLPPLIDRAIHRTVQESLTNAARHCPGAPVTITIERTSEHTAVTITNPLRENTSHSMDPDGSGLAGLREQARLVGGTLVAGPDDDTFVVRARFPTAAA